MKHQITYLPDIEGYKLYVANKGSSACHIMVSTPEGVAIDYFSLFTWDFWSERQTGNPRWHLPEYPESVKQFVRAYANMMS